MIYFDDRFILGIRLIDVQHKRIVDLLNQFEVLIEELKIEEAVICLQNMYDFTQNHFKSEEVFYNHYNSPFLEEHLDLHIKITTELEGLINTIKENDNKIEELKKTCNFLMNWIEQHIIIEDKKMIKSIL